MTPEMSRACATVKHVLNLPTGPQMDELLVAASAAESTSDLPNWAQAALRYAERQASK